MAKDLKEEYMIAYKELETTVKDEGLGTVLDYEKSLPQTEASKMQICRILRNHMAHSSDRNFVAVTPDMIAFVNEQTYKLQCKHGTLKDYMQSVAKYGFITDDMSVVDVAALLAKKNRSRGLVMNKKGVLVGILSKDIISDIAGEGMLTKTLKVNKILNKLMTDYVVNDSYSKDTAMSVISARIAKNPSEIIIVKANTGKIVGVYNA